MIPERFSYESIDSDGCVGGDYVLRVDSRNGTREPVAYSSITDGSSIYVLKTVDEDESGRKYNQYWDFGDGWDHIDDFLYNGATNIFRGFDDSIHFEVIVNIGRIKNANSLSTETYERSISLLIPANLQELDLPGISGEESITGEAKPVMFNSIEILNELYWVMREFSKDHSNFQEYLDGKTGSHSINSNNSIRAYRALALAYPFFEGLIVQLIDREDLKAKSYKGESGIRFKYLKSLNRQTNIKSNIDTLEGSRGTINSYERDFLVETFYNESIDVGVSRNDLSHNIFDATRGFQNINWRELARRLIVSIAFLDEKVVCTYSDIDAADLRIFERWLAERERAGFDNLQKTVFHGKRK